MYKEIIDKLLTYPQKEQIQINFDLRKKTFFISAPIFSSKKLPNVVKEYALARKNLTFKPHATSYEVRGEKIFLVQQIPFSLCFQVTSKKDVEQFLQLSRHCHKMLSEIAIEETYQGVFRS